MSAKYVPAGSKCLLLKPTGEATWYTTKKEVDATAAKEALCPATGRTVLTTEEGGYKLFFPPEVVCLRRAEIPQMSVLNYDIPQNAEIANPSNRLRRVAVRTTLSDWIVPTAAIPWTIINDLREAGATVTLYKFDPSEGPALLFAVENALRAQIRQAGESADASAESAAEQFANSDKANRSKYYEQRLATAHKQAKEKLEAYEAAAGVFGFDAKVLGLQAASHVAQTILNGTALRAQKYVEARALLAAQNTATAEGLAAAAADDTLPAEIMADALRDHGQDVAADQLQAAFAAPETFSLDGMGDE